MNDHSTILDAKLEDLLLQFEEISLQEAIKIDLNTRKEMKFVLAKNIFLSSLPVLIEYFRLQKNFSGDAVNVYATRYWDTENKKSFTDHVTKRNNRVKIRKRKYLDSGEVVFEIKRKTNGTTIKQRLKSEKLTELTARDNLFLQKNNIRSEDLIHSLDTFYKRITLWDKKLSGRITIDFDYGIGIGEKEHEFLNSCIIECKGNSGFLKKVVKMFSVPMYRYETGFSKYAIGMIHQYAFGSEQAKTLLPVYKNFCKLNNV